MDGLYYNEKPQKHENTPTVKKVSPWHICYDSKPEKDGNYICQLTNGIVCVCDAKETVLPFGMPEKEFSNTTDGLGRDFSLKPWKWTIIPTGEVSGILLATDGVADDLEEQYAGVFLRGIIDAARTDGPKVVEKDLTAILENWPVAGHSDDKTIAGIFREELDV